MNQLIFRTLASLLLLMGLPLNSGLDACSLCPFCASVALTFTEQIESKEVCVIAELTEKPPLANPDDDELPQAKFSITQVLKGQEIVATGMTFPAILIGDHKVGDQFLLYGEQPPEIQWTTPTKATHKIIKYLQDIQELPQSGADRLAFFQNYFEDEEKALGFDAYDEFAKASYEDLQSLKDRMQRKKLLRWIEDPETSLNRRRLYFTMLGVCGQAEDVVLLEKLIQSDSRKQRRGLDALIACYLILKGAEGVDLIEKQFLDDEGVDYVDTSAALSALRFHATEVDKVPLPRIVQAARHILDRPKFADLVIPDLARWEDWEVMERLVTMFKKADPDSNWIRVPIASYLFACPLPAAKQHITELEQLDSDSIERARFFENFNSGSDDDDWDDETENPDTESAEPAQETAPTTPTAPTNSTYQHSVSQAVYVSENTSMNPPEIQASFNSQNPDNHASQASNSGSVAYAIVDVDTKTPNQTSVALVSSTIAKSPSTPLAPSTVSPQPETTKQNFVMPIIFIPMASCFVIFVLMWSVIHGWFERLIF